MPLVHFGFSKGLVLFPKLTLDYDPPACVFCVTGITGMYHHTQLVLRKMISLTFCPFWPLTAILQSLPSL
jgi:hypothetical protein